MTTAKSALSSIFSRMALQQNLKSFFMRSIFALLPVSLSYSCAAVQYTVDDGRKVNQELLGQIRNYGIGEKALRAAVARSAKLNDPNCDKQQELPFSTATSYGESDDERIAWKRALDVDERLTVIAAAPDSPLKPGDRIEKIGAFAVRDTEKMMLFLAKMRDDGAAFEVMLAGGKRTKVKPFKVCRGYTRLAPPKSPQTQDYHWLMSIHPLEVVRGDLSEDEALWMVLWAQGLSEEGGARMKSYQYGTGIASTMFTLFTIATGVQAASLASEAALNIAKSTIRSYATDLLREQVVDQVMKPTPQQMMSAMQRSAANRKALKGVAWIAAGVFEKADAWAYARMEKLQANPLAAFTLHQKLVERNLTSNAMLLDPDRFKALNNIASAEGRSEEVVAILQGIKPEDLQFEVTDMPLASDAAPFSYEDAGDPTASSQPFANGLIDGMLRMPVTSSLNE